MSELFYLAPEVARALGNGAPVVALESTVIAHGLPWPQNAEAALEMERAVRREGAVPATIGLGGGKVRVGLSAGEVEELARSGQVIKTSRADLAAVLARGELGATTVAATAWAAAAKGISVVATGGLGGVHRSSLPAETSWDVSADLAELGRSAVTVVCSGVKAILDLPRTREALETLGIPVVGFATKELPAFYCAASGLELDQSVDTVAEAAAVVHVHRRLGLGGLLLVQAPPVDAALERKLVEAWIARALAEATDAGVAGKAATPFLLRRLHELSEGKTLIANRKLLVANAALGARLAVELAGTEQAAGY